VRTLAAVVAEGTEEVVLARDFTGWVEKTSEDVPSYMSPVVVQAVLQRTAVVYERGHVDEKRVVRLDHVFVEERDVKWVPRNPVELRIMRSRRIGQALGTGFRNGKAA
jgi:hypothetical protein